ncbi:hypothetical protein ACP4OV_025100 [Aristida adscensionis]
MYTRNRKYDSGAEKRKKKPRLEAAAAQSQRGALDRFVLRGTNANVDDNHDHEDHAPTVEVGTPLVENVEGDHDGHDHGVDVAQT